VVFSDLWSRKRPLSVPLCPSICPSVPLFPQSCDVCQDLSLCVWLNVCSAKMNGRFPFIWVPEFNFRSSEKVAGNTCSGRELRGRQWRGELGDVGGSLWQRWENDMERFLMMKGIQVQRTISRQPWRRGVGWSPQQRAHGSHCGHGCSRSRKSQWRLCGWFYLRISLWLKLMTNSYRIWDIMTLIFQNKVPLSSSPFTVLFCFPFR
jgi:hypothetical protein